MNRQKVMNRREVTGQLRNTATLMAKLRNMTLKEPLNGKQFTGLKKEHALEVAQEIVAAEDIVELALIAFRAHKLVRLAAGDDEIGIDQCGSTYYIQNPCPQGCAFCVLATNPENWNPLPQRFNTPEEFLQEALSAEKNGATHYKIVTLKQRLTKSEFDLIIRAYEMIKEQTSLMLCGSFGAFLTTEEMLRLREVGVDQINCNIECARSYAPTLFGLKDLDNPLTPQWRIKYERLRTQGKLDEERVFRTKMSDGKEHTFCTFTQDAFELWEAKHRLIETAMHLGMKVCCGGIVGAGETKEQRIELFFELKKLGVHTSPFNVFVPQKGTPLESLKALTPLEILKSLALFRLISPAQKIMYNAGVQYMGDLLPLVLLSGVNGLGSGTYLNKEIGQRIAQMCDEFGLGHGIVDSKDGDGE